MENVARQIRRKGQLVTLRRLTGSGPQSRHDVEVRAAVLAYAPDELAAANTQATRWVRLTDHEIRVMAWPGPPAEDDVVIINQREYTVLAADSRRLTARETIHVLAVKG